MQKNKLDSALILRIANAACKEFNQDDIYIAQAPIGMGLGDQHLELLQKLEEDRLDDAASVARLVEISRIVDCIQVHRDHLDTPDQDLGYLSDVFPKLIKDIKFLSCPSVHEKQEQYLEAQKILYEDPPFLKTPAYQEFCILRSEVENKEIALLEMRLKLGDLLPSEEQEILNIEISNNKELCQEKREALDALDRMYCFKQAEVLIDSMGRELSEIPTSVRAGLDSMEIFQITDPISNVTHTGCSFFPSQLAEDNWISLKITRDEIDLRNDELESELIPDLRINPFEIDFIELEVQTIVCERTWFWRGLFENKNWDWAVPSVPISTGDGGGQIPGFIHGLVFARNLFVKRRRARADQVRQTVKDVLPETNRTVEASRGPDPKSKPSKIPIRRIITNLSNPRVARSMVTPTVVRRSSVGPAVVSRTNTTRPTLRPVSDGRVRVDQSRRQVVTTTITEPGARSRMGGITLGRAAPTAIVRAGVINKYTAKGRITDERGTGIYLAYITLEGNAGQRKVTTSRDGSFSFPSIDRGRYRLKIEKAGYLQTLGSIDVPQKSSLIIAMRQSGQSQVTVSLQSIDGTPFSGPAKVLIRSANSRRLESMDGRSQATYSLPAGNYLISVSSSQAESVDPVSLPIRILNNSQTQHKLSFRIIQSTVHENRKVQLIGFLCRRVPLCPDPENNNQK